MTTLTSPPFSMSPPVVSIIGKPDSGKTTLLEKLIPLLSGQGFKIGVIKHHVHTFEMDQPGKDTWKIKKAGATAVALSAPSGLGIIRDTTADTTIEELVSRYFYDMDLVLTEGYKQEEMPKIEVYRSTQHDQPLQRTPCWVSMVSDVHVHQDLPHFHLDDTEGLAAFLVEKYIQKVRTPIVTLFVDGRQIPLNNFVEGFIRQAILGMTSVLKGVDNPRKLKVTIKND